MKSRKMKSPSRCAPRRMDSEAYAGFLKLLLTPADQVPESTPEIRAYLRYLAECEPLSDESRRALGEPSERAA